MGSDLWNMWMNKFNKKKGVFLMSKMIKRIMAMGVVCSMLFAMIAQ